MADEEPSSGDMSKGYPISKQSGKGRGRVGHHQESGGCGGGAESSLRHSSRLVITTKETKTLPVTMVEDKQQSPELNISNMSDNTKNTVTKVVDDDKQGTVVTKVRSPWRPAQKRNE